MPFATAFIFGWSDGCATAQPEQRSNRARRERRHFYSSENLFTVQAVDILVR